MKKILLSILVSVLALAAFAQSSLYQQPIRTDADRFVQNKMATYATKYYTNTWNIGSAKKLEGKIYILEIWLTETGTKWDINDVYDMQGKINDAAEWIKKQAASYGRNLEIEMGCFAGNNYEGIQMTRLPRSLQEAGNDTELMNKAMRLIGYNSSMDFYNLYTQKGFDNIITLVLFNNDGWSCANQFSTDNAKFGQTVNFMENAYIFKTIQYQPTNKQAIVHEMLHLFGAWDMYSPQVHPNSESWAKAYYPNEIMLQVSSPLENLMISPLTAWLTGLSSEYNDWYWYFLRM